MQQHPNAVQPNQKEPLKISYSAQELRFYSALFDKADQLKDGQIGGREAVQFLTLSGVSRDKLRAFWVICARSSPAALTKEEFFTALRLIAYEQNGIPADENSLT